jgi:flavin-binding protein dodecin
MVFEKITLIGTSAESFDDAVDDAVGRAEATLDDLKWAEVSEMGVEVASVEVVLHRVRSVFAEPIRARFVYFRCSEGDAVE